MEAALFVMAILGCADSGDLCAEERVAAPRYVSLAACQADVAATLVQHSDVSAPVIMAACRPVTTQFAENNAGPRGAE